MAIYTIADTHLSLTTDKPMDIFGSRWENYIEKLTNGWKSAVTDEDTVVIPGDISWGMNLEEALEDFRFLESLPGKKLLGKGNHDYWWTSLTKMNAFFEENGLTTLKFLYNNAYSCEDINICGSRGWYVDKNNSPKNTDYDKIVSREAARLELSLSAAVCKLQMRRAARCDASPRGKAVLLRSYSRSIRPSAGDGRRGN